MWLWASCLPHVKNILLLYFVNTYCVPTLPWGNGMNGMERSKCYSLIPFQFWHWVYEKWVQISCKQAHINSQTHLPFPSLSLTNGAAQPSYGDGRRRGYNLHLCILLSLFWLSHGIVLRLQVRKWRLREGKWPGFCPVSVEALLESSLLTGHHHRWSRNGQVWKLTTFCISSIVNKGI